MVFSLSSGEEGFEGVEQANVCKAYGEGDELLEAWGTVTSKRFVGITGCCSTDSKPIVWTWRPTSRIVPPMAWKAFGKSRFVSTDGIHGCICVQHERG